MRRTAGLPSDTARARRRSSFIIEPRQGREPYEWRPRRSISDCGSQEQSLRWPATRWLVPVGCPRDELRGGPIRGMVQLFPGFAIVVGARSNEGLDYLNISAAPALEFPEAAPISAAIRDLYVSRLFLRCRGVKTPALREVGAADPAAAGDARGRGEVTSPRHTNPARIPSSL